MTLPVSGSLSLSDVLIELRRTNPARTVPISLGDADVLALAGKSAPVSLSDLYGKSGYASMTITGHDDFSSRNSTLSGGTASCTPSITVTGGTGSYSVSWAFVSNPDGCSLSSSGLSCTVSHNYSRNANGGATATVRATVNDGIATQTRDVSAVLDWSNNA